MESGNNEKVIINLKDFRLIKISNKKNFKKALKEIPRCQVRNFRIIIEKLGGLIEDGPFFLGKGKYRKVAVFKEEGGEAKIFIPYMDSSGEYKGSFIFFVKGRIEIEPIVEKIIKEIDNIGKS